MQVKDSKTVVCQDLEESLGAPGSWVGTQPKGAGQDWDWVFALTMQHPWCSTIHMQTQLIWSPALLQGQGSQERRDPAAGWKVLMRRETSLPRASTPAVCCSQEAWWLSWQPGGEHTPRGSCWVVSVWRMSSALSSVCTPLEPGALCFCRLISAEDESYLCVKSSGDDTWQSLFSALHPDGVSRQSLLGKKKKKIENLCSCLNSSKSAALPCEKVFLIQLQKKHIWDCSDRLFSNQFLRCVGLEKQINHLYYSTVNWI